MKHILNTSALLLGLAFSMVSAAETPVPETPAAETPAAETPAAETPAAETVKEDSSYALGYRMGNMFSQQFGRFGVGMDDLETGNFLKGFSAAVKGDKPEIEEEKLQAAMEALGDMLQKREEQTAANNLEAGRKFLEENAKREGVITTASGLQYEILEKGGDEKYAGTGEDEEDNKEFLVNYKGTLIDGREFDSSPPGEPVPMTLQVVEGFREALTTMPVGAKWKVYLPADLAYGEERRSAEIGPNSALVFELELVRIQDAPAPEGMPFPFPIPQGQ